MTTLVSRAERRGDLETAGIAFLDDDHVLRAVRGLLTARTAKQWREVAAFFAPDTPDVAELRRLRAGLEPADGVRVLTGTDDATVLVLRRGQVSESLLEAHPRLRLVQRLGARSDGIDLVAAREHGVEVSCLPRPSLALTAEHAMLLMLALAKRLMPADRAVRSGHDGRLARGVDSSAVTYNWAAVAGIGGLAGRTLGIVGFGEVGRLVGERANAFGMRVLYTSRHRLPADSESRARVDYRTLHALLRESDIVSLHVPGTIGRTPVIGRAEIATMRPGALLVNTSRGWLVDEDPLYDALAAGRLGGAGLDVHRAEPRPPGDRFCQLDNVVLTPHIAGGSRLGVLDEIAAIFDNIRHILADDVPPHGRMVGGTR